MPIYEYKCNACEATVEVVQAFGAPPPEICPTCGGGPLQKLISQSSFILKGGGWYKDGYSGPSNQSKKSDTSSSDTNNKNTTPASDAGDTKETTTSTKDTKPSGTPSNTNTSGTNAE